MVKIMNYFISTRGDEQQFSSMEAILKGLSNDGGLFVPNKLPKIDYKDFIEQKSTFKDISATILYSFFDEYNFKEIKDIVDNSYSSFDCNEVVPIKKIGEEYIAELFHGETLAFKDIALSVLPHLMSLALKKKQQNKNIFILTATSGDTGSAALYGFKNIDNIKICVFYPKIGISEIQKKQMTNIEAKNVFVCGINGNFDDAQSGVKYIFNNIDKQKLQEKKIILSSANSINIGRLIPQIAYYFYSYIELINKKQIKEGEQVNFCVPTGNFGNILAGYFAKLLGLPIKKLLCASNENNILTEFIETGIYNKNKIFKNTLSPSMDILVASNLERLLYFISNKDTNFVKKCMKDLEINEKYEIDKSKLEKIQENFSCDFTNDEDTKNTINYVFNKFKYTLDPHTAVGYNCIKKYKQKTKDKTKCVLLSTASPFKFTDTCLDSLHINTKQLNLVNKLEELSKLSNKDIPEQLQNILNKNENFKDIIEKDKMMEYVLNCINNNKYEK